MASDYPVETCQHCGNWHGGVCPRIKSIEYFHDGIIRRVEYRRTDADVDATGKEPQELRDWKNSEGV